MRAMLLTLATLIVGCGKGAPPPGDPTVVASPTASPDGTPPVAPQPDASSTIRVQMTAATLADDCGGAAPIAPPDAPPSSKSASLPNPATGPTAGDAPKAKRRCNQTSIQLSISAPAGASPADFTVTRVEIVDEHGESLGVVKATAPRRWSGDAYVDWDQKVAPGTELAVSYALSEPDWSKARDRFGKTYVVKAVVSVGGAEHGVQTQVEVEAPTSPPSIVKT